MKTIINLVDEGLVWKFHGGIYPPSRKERTKNVAITTAALPKHLYLSLAQHIGQPAVPIVKIGEYVAKGQILAKQDGFFSAPIIAPTSGTISDICLYRNSHPSGIDTPTIILTPDHLETWRHRHPLALSDDNSLLLERISQSGISGLGGASFPTAVKLSTSDAIDFLIINGAECEPYITSDDLLMQQHSDTIIAGVEIMNKLLSPKRIIIAIEDNKPEAISAITNAVKRIESRLDIIVRTIPTLYPAGGEKQLIEVLTSKQVPSGKIPADIGILVQNVATSYAVAQAILDDHPLLSRIVTVTGDLIDKPGNYEAPIGIRVKDLLEQANFRSQAEQKIIIGGPMMGFALHHVAAPVIKATNCIIAASPVELPEPPAEQNCIRCGDCEQVCPANLLPQQLQWFAKDKDQAKLISHNLFDCIECGACSYVCPSAIPLVQYYRIAKSEIKQSNEEKRQAERAKERFEQRNRRLERDKEERLERNKKAAQARQAAMSKNNDGDAVAAALARVKAKKAAQQPAEPGTDNLADSGKDRVAAAIARAKAKKARQQASPTTASESARPAAMPQPETAPAAETSTSAAVDPQKARVAAAIARAKAKKAQQQTATDISKSVRPPEAVADNPSAKPKELADDNDKKARIAAAVAKAKAKKAAQQTATDMRDPEKVADNPSAKPKEPADDNDKKARIAAAVAKAKAKKAAQQQVRKNDNDNDQT